MWNNDSHLVKSPLLITSATSTNTVEPKRRTWLLVLKGELFCLRFCRLGEKRWVKIWSPVSDFPWFSVRNDNKRGLHENGGRADAGREHRLGGVRVTDLWPLGGGGFWVILVRGWGLLKDPFSVTWPSHSHLHNTPTPPPYSDWDLFKMRSGLYAPPPLPSAHDRVLPIRPPQTHGLTPREQRPRGGSRFWHPHRKLS